MKTVLLPYTSIDGISTFPDSFIKGLFKRMEEDQTVETVFLDGSVTNADEFLDMMKFGKNLLWIINVDNEIVGICWLNNFEEKKAWFHFCFFSNAWGKDTVEIGKKSVLYLLELEKDGEYHFDLLTGLVPERNEKALKWCNKMNFRLLGRLPCSAWNAEEQKSEGGIIFYVERGIYHG